MNKCADLKSRLLEMIRTPAHAGLLGGKLRDKARKHGVDLIFSNKADWPKYKPDTLSKVLGADRHMTGGSIPMDNPKAVKFSPVDLVSNPVSTRTPISADPSPDSKLRTDPIFGAPKSKGAHQILGAKKLQGTAEEAKKIEAVLGKRWIAKHIHGSASDPGSMPTETSFEKLKGLDPATLMVQQRIPLKSVGVLEQKANDLLQKYVPASKNINRGSREYRVHVIGGQRVPYGTTQRGSSTGKILDLIRPFKTSEMEAAEKHVDEMMAKAPKAWRKGNYGFDVGIDQDGKPFTIEPNPSTLGAGSGGFASDVGASAVRAGIQGKLPTYVKIRTGAYGLGTAGAAGYVYHKLKNDRSS